MKKLSELIIHRYYSLFKVISLDKAVELNLEWKENIHGDEINKLNCRSLWINSRGWVFRVEDLAWEGFNKLYD